MEFLDRMRRFGSLQRIRTRVQNLSAGFAQSPLAVHLRRQRKLLSGAGWTVLALALGVWAHDLAQAEALGGWLKAHPPSAPVWRHSLESRGYRLLTGASQIQKASRSLPSLVDEEGSVWVSSGTDWVAIYLQQEAGQSASLYCLDCTRPPQGWEPLGRGWEAFDPALARADAAVAAMPKPAPAVRAMPTDPMELRY